MTTSPLLGDAAARKARGAFFTPEPIARFMVEWAIKEPNDRVLDPSCGDAAFLVPAVERLRALGVAGSPRVSGFDIDPDTATLAAQRVTQAGGEAEIVTGDFFDAKESGAFDVVVGNPPYIRYQEFTGKSRAGALEAALRGGVGLSALASSWAPFTVHAARFLRPGGKLAFVLPAELLSVNYAAPVRRFLFENFGAIQLVLFERQVFADAEADVVLLLASDFGSNTKGARICQVHDEFDLPNIQTRDPWFPADPADKWTQALTGPEVSAGLAQLSSGGAFVSLAEWGTIRLGAVTGNNRFFTMTKNRARDLGLADEDLVRISPPGSSHLRFLDLSAGDLDELDARGAKTYLFHPREPLALDARHYVEAGTTTEVDRAYKCRVRSPWYRVPLVQTPDLFLTAMNADTPRLATNEARVYHLNSVHGFYLNTGLEELGAALLPLASLNSVTLLSAELVGRSYGGGVLKLEPGEARRWLLPSPKLVTDKRESLEGIRDTVLERLREGKLWEAVSLVDEQLLLPQLGTADLATLTESALALARRRQRRGRKHG